MKHRLNWLPSETSTLLESRKCNRVRSALFRGEFSDLPRWIMGGNRESKK
jgi:hypothetical protein